MTIKLANNATSALTAAISAADTTMTVADGSVFPALSAGEWFPATLVDASGNIEIVKITARSGGTLTATRAQEGTTAKNFGAGSRIDLRMTAGALSAQINDAIALEATARDAAIALAVAGRMPILATGEPLPTSDIGPIWHADYNDVLIWQTFNANGANYTGYASKDIGGIKTEMMSTPRSGWIKRNGSSLSRTTYAALRGWAMHNGLFIPAASWTSGIGRFCDNADGTTFNVPDVRGEFGRYWDDGRGVDSSRILGSWQDSDNKSHGHTGYTTTDGWHGHGLPGDIWYNRGPGLKMRDDGDGYWVNNQGGGTDGSGNHSHSVVVNAAGGGESRGRNVSELAVIKF